MSLSCTGGSIRAQIGCRIPGETPPFGAAIAYAAPAADTQDVGSVKSAAK
jgi:hypothetical protein